MTNQLLSPRNGERKFPVYRWRHYDLYDMSLCHVTMSSLYVYMITFHTKGFHGFLSCLNRCWSTEDKLRSAATFWKRSTKWNLRNPQLRPVSQIPRGQQKPTNIRSAVCKNWILFPHSCLRGCPEEEEKGEEEEREEEDMRRRIWGGELRRETSSKKVKLRQDSHLSVINLSEVVSVCASDKMYRMTAAQISLLWERFAYYLKKRQRSSHAKKANIYLSLTRWTKEKKDGRTDGRTNGLTTAMQSRG